MKMKFKDLSINDLFVFESEVSMPNSGMVTGPWIKISDRKYKHMGHGMVCVVGSVSVEVIIEEE